MSLSEKIEKLRDKALVELRSAHDYYVDTLTAWQLVQLTIDAGQTLSSRNNITGTITNEKTLIEKSRGYIADQLTEATFQQFLTIFESFFFDFLGLWLATYPKSLSGKKVDFKAVLEAPDKDAIIERVVGKELNGVLYERPAGWFAYLEEKVKLGCPSTIEIEKISEAKASRDMLVHNRGLANRSYLSKAGPLARYQDGERVEISSSYHQQTWVLLSQVITDISHAAIAKAA